MAAVEKTGNFQTSGYRRKLLSERIHYRAPFNYVIMTARIEGRIPAELLSNALNKAYAMHPLLRARIETDCDGNAWFTQSEEQELSAEVFNKESDLNWIDKAIEEYRKPFRLDRGPLIRFILLDSPECSDLMIVCHHTICDGMSLVYLVRDIMTFIGDPGREPNPVPIPPALDLDCFTEPAGIGLLPKFLLGRFNNAWKKQKRVFGEDDYDRIYNNFWSKEKLNIIIHTSEEETLKSLISRCRKEGVTVNSAVAAAFVTAQNEVQKNVARFSKTGIAVNLRSRMADSPGEGVGFFAGGSAVQLKYDSGKPFWVLAREFDRQVKKLLGDSQRLYEMMLMNILDQTLVDSVFFHLFGGFENKTASALTKLLHFDRKTPGLGVTNLGKADIPQTYGPYNLKTLFFVPPNIPGGEKILGVVTAGGKINLSLACLESALGPEILKAIMDCAVDCLQKAIIG